MICGPLQVYIRGLLCKCGFEGSCFKEVSCFLIFEIKEKKNYWDLYMIIIKRNMKVLGGKDGLIPSQKFTKKRVVQVDTESCPMAAKASCVTNRWRRSLDLGTALVRGPSLQRQSVGLVVSIRGYHSLCCRHYSCNI